MILYAICDYLKTQSYAEGVQQEIVVSVGDWRKKFTMSQSEATTIKIPATALSKGKNQLKFAGKAPRAMFRSVLTAYQRGNNIKPISSGIEVKREFYLLDENGAQVRKLESGDSIEKGAYVESVVTAKHRDSEMAYVLVENPKPAGSEILPDTDTRFKRHSTHFALREDKTSGVAYHHQQTGQSLVDRCVLHVELGGSYMVPPARAELMYNTLDSGSSDGFNLIVK